MATKKKEGNLVTFVAKVKVQRYYKDGFGIYVVEPTGNKDKVKVDKDNQVVISGNMGNTLIPELEYIITGKEVIHPRFGLQYQISSIMRESKTDGVSDFLYAILPKNQVDTLLDVYPNIVSMIMKNETIDFSKTKGIKEASFEKIKKKIFDNYDKFDLLVTYGDTLTQAMLDKILKVYTQGTKQIKSLINTNPYQFFLSLSGVGFKTADGLILALEDKGKIVFEQPLRTSIQRMYKAIEYILEQNESSGNTCMDLKGLREECAKLTPECMGTFVECIRNVSDKVYLDKEHGLIGLKRTRDKELFIYNKLNKMNNMDNIWEIIDIEDYREVNGIRLTEEQFNTAKLMSEKNAIVLVGNGGSGKSMSMMSFVKACDNSNISYSLCSPTGKASKVMSNYTGKKAKTIHRLLEYNPDNLEEYGSFFKYNANNKLPTDLIIIDEFGMCDVDLFYNLLLAIDENRTKLLIIGDDGQLPSVGAGNILHDLIHLNIIPINRLTIIFRYKEGGLAQACEDNRNGIPYLEAIKSNSTKVLGNNKDFIHMERYDTPSTLKCVEDCFTNLIKKYPIEDVVILVAQNKGDLGTVNINKRLQAIYHKGKTSEKFLMMGEDNKFIEGDKVVQNKNNYKATSYPDKGKTSVFNGNTGTIISIHFDEVIIDFDGEMVVYNKEDMVNVSLAYAMTVHKAQGSQFKNVILCLPKAHTFMLNSNIIYTGESRTSWRCFVVGNLMTINRAIKKRANLSRNTWLSIM